MLNCDGNPENVLKTLASEENLKSLLSATLKGSFAGQSSGSFFDKLISKGINNTIGAGLDKLIMNKSLDQGVIDAWINAGIETVAQVCANKIGELYKPDEIKPNGLKTDGLRRTTDAVNKINWGTHKILHGALASLTGGIRSKLSGSSFEQGAVAVRLLPQRLWKC